MQLDWSVIAGITTIASMWIGLVEKRFASMKSWVEEKMQASKELNAAIQDNLEKRLDKLDNSIEGLTSLIVNHVLKENQNARKEKPTNRSDD